MYYYECLIENLTNNPVRSVMFYDQFLERIFCRNIQLLYNNKFIHVLMLGLVLEIKVKVSFRFKGDSLQLF